MRKKLDFQKQIFEKNLKIKFHYNPSSGRRVVPCGRTDRWIDITKLIVAFQNFAKGNASYKLKSISVNVLNLQVEIVCGFSRPGSLCGLVKIFPNKTQFFTIIVLGENIWPTHSPTLLHYMLYQTGNF